MAEQAEGLLRSPGRQLLLCADAASSSKRLKVVEDSGGASLPDGPDGHDELKALQEHVDNRFKMLDDRLFACEKMLKRLRNESMNIWEHVQFLAEGERERRGLSSSSAAEAPSAEAP
jgi:hypothetical protein